MKKENILEPLAGAKGEGLNPLTTYASRLTGLIFWCLEFRASDFMLGVNIR